VNQINDNGYCSGREFINLPRFRGYDIPYFSNIFVKEVSTVTELRHFVLGVLGVKNIRGRVGVCVGVGVGLS
jgi:hypothetical protein